MDSDSVDVESYRNPAPHRLAGRGLDHDRVEGEAGAIAVMVAILGVSLMLVVGLVFEGGVAIAAKRRAMNVAEQAARAGAEQLDLNAVREGTGFRIDPGAAVAAADAYLAGAGFSGSVGVSGDTVTVSGVAWSSQDPMLGTLGVHFSGTVAAAHARNLHGVVTVEN
ncbi:MAG TPA: TadE/TadG family type IV pilus assembly protein [Actinomycetota bacterium]